MIFLVAQRDIRDDEPTAKQLYSVGCVAKIRQIIKSNNEGVRVVVEGVSRGRLKALAAAEGGLSGTVQILSDRKTRGSKMIEQALLRTAKEAFTSYADLNPKLAPDISLAVMAENNIGALSDYIAGNVLLPPEDRQMVLEETNPLHRLETVIVLLKSEYNLLQLEKEIGDRVREQMDDNQRDYFLREQMKAIAEELGEDDNPQAEAEEYNEKINALQCSDEVKAKLHKEAARLSKMPQGSHEATVVRGYLDFCLSVPFGKYAKEKYEVSKAERVLNRDHYGLEKVKERILELIAVKSLSPNLSGQILCLVGPPGTGKTSVARSIARATGRKYVRISLGGVRDEADIRGHRRTYIGAMPGRIVSAVQQSGTMNPLILMDEIDKLGSDYRGDPSAALLEALDPEQNKEFQDHFLELPLDLSRVLFVLTANSTETIPPALMDRMEIIELSSYTREEKFQIARRHLLNKQMKRHGLSKEVFSVSSDALYSLIDQYTKEAGVRGLERQLAALCRKAAKQLADGAPKVTVHAAQLAELLGVPRYKNDAFSKEDQVGVVNGLAWTSVGGEMLQIEAAALPGTGKIILTGSLGDVMKESAQAAVSYLRSRASVLNVPVDFYKSMDLHIHAPEGAVPKDGPSAGITMAVAILSALSGQPVRGNVAMTGEITLRGRVLPIGGLREKTMAALKNQISTVIIPKENEADLAELPEIVKQHITFVTASHLDEVLPVAFAQGQFFVSAQQERPQPLLQDIQSQATPTIAN